MALLAQVSTQRLIVDNISANTLKLSTITVSTIFSGYFIGDGSLLTNLVGEVSASNLQSTLEGLGTSGYVSSLTLASTVDSLGTLGYVSSLSMTSSINEAISSLSTAYGAIGGGGIASIPPILSTFAVLTSSLRTSSLQANTSYFGSISASTINISTLTTLSMNASTTGFISSLIVNSLQFGDGTGWVNMGPLQTVALSSIQINTNSIYTNNTYIGNVSTVNALQFYGLFGNYNNTVLAEVSTGAGTQELLFFKGSSVSDRVRVQTTGSFVIETGVSSRLWSNTTLNTLSNTTPAFIVNTSSNVGIQTATPQTTLDVAGTGRFLILSTMAIWTSSIVAPYTYTPQYFTF